MNVSRSQDVLVRMEGVDLGYGGPPVLKGVDLTIRKGRFLGLVGPNGAGKTTLLRSLIGLLKPLCGRIEVGLGGDRRRITLGYVPQVQSLDPIYPLTVHEVVRMGGFKRQGLFRPWRGEDRAFLHPCLQAVGMEEKGGMLFSRLSSGQKQRVLIARALFARPDLLLLDEPTSGADMEGEKRVMDLLARLNRKGHTIILVCHELDAVQRTAREILWIHGGRVHLDTTADFISGNRLARMFGVDEKPASQKDVLPGGKEGPS